MPPPTRPFWAEPSSTPQQSASDSKLERSSNEIERPADSAPTGSVGGDGHIEKAPALADLETAISAWIRGGKPASLVRWLRRELDDEGVPRRLPVVVWSTCLASLAEARLQRGGQWPAEADARIGGLLLAALRFSRPSGSVVFGSMSESRERMAVLRFWSERLSDPGPSAVLEGWVSRNSHQKRARCSLPAPSDARAGRALAILRSNWTPQGDFVALEQRAGSDECRVELFGRGRHWLGPDWTAGAAATVPRRLCWHTSKEADLAEWTFRTATARVTRTALLVHGRQLALLADQVNSLEPMPCLRVAMAPEVKPVSGPESRALVLEAGRGRSARVLPVGLPALPYVTERGSFGAEGSTLVLRHRNAGKRCWLPLLVTWRPERDRRPMHWRILTVSENSRICPPDVACAVRVSWGRGESLVIYRSLAHAARRSFLGHQTRARFLVGLFTKDGDVEPIVSVED